MYLNTNLKVYQCKRLHNNMIPQEMIDHYNLINKVTSDVYLYYKIHKEIYRLKESGKLANIDL